VLAFAGAYAWYTPDNAACVNHEARLQGAGDVYLNVGGKVRSEVESGVRRLYLTWVYFVGILRA